GKELYRASCAHAAAHLAYTEKPISPEALNPAQMFMIGLIEDARVEQLAIRQFPGLKQLWLPLHEAGMDGRESRGSVLSFLERLAHALLDRELETGDALIRETVSAFWDAFTTRPHD